MAILTHGLPSSPVGRLLEHWPAAASLMPSGFKSALLGYSTASDAADGLLFGWDIATMQTTALFYLGLSSLAFVTVWIIGYLRRR
jgi:hypothetical protein